ncbi:hypothetical protein [Sulfurimonas sp. HSL-1716]|uniref:hypothetical protein n=1 Tax=Hydrocurvibacter sulfurireducens TaxID=3131937 RepID=UPI0031F96967
MNIRLVPAPISITFSPAAEDEENFLREYHKLSQTDDDPIAQWLKLAKARGDTSQSDPVLLNLMVELHRKIDELEKFIKDEKPVRIELMHHADIESIGFHHFKIKEEILSAGVEYYGRIEMPVYPKRDIGIYFKALDGDIAEIIKMHDRDEKEWNTYLTARERILIREMKEGKSDTD